MRDLKIFKTHEDVALEVAEATTYKFEKDLQAIVEKNMFNIFGVTFLAHEYSISGDTGKGRMDSIGIDENNCPVIFEYKKVENENVINQGLFYLDWLLKHRCDFEMLVSNVLGKERSKIIEWSEPRVLCIAPDFNKYDEGAINLISHNVELIKWKSFDDNLLVFEYFKQSGSSHINKTNTKASELLTFKNRLNSSTDVIKNIIQEIDNYILGDEFEDATVSVLKHYKAYKRIKNFACVVAEKEKVLMYLPIMPSSDNLIDNFTRDVTGRGHLGTGNFEITIKDENDFEKAKQFIKAAYQE